MKLISSWQNKVEVGTGLKWSVCTRYMVSNHATYWAYRCFNLLIRIAGPIVRISPWEVQIKDPDWNDIYKLSSKACKPKWYYKSFGSTLSTNTTESDQLHRIHRQALTSWFSTQNITQSEPTIQATIDKLHDRLLASSGKVVNLGDVYRCLAIDVATGFAFQKAFGNLNDPNFSRDFNNAVRNYGRTGIFNRHFWGIPFKLLQSLPQSISTKLNPAVGAFMTVSHQYWSAQQFGLTFEL